MSVPTSTCPVPTSTDPVPFTAVSVSQLNTYERCPRRWFLNKVRRQPIKQKVSAAVGSDIHRILEKWFKRGMWQGPPEHLEKARAAAAQLPNPDPALLVEHHISLPLTLSSGQRLKFTGVIDLVDPRGSTVDLTDHKTTSRIEQLRVKPVDLLTDPQMLTYAEWAYRTFQKPVRVTHNTISTKHKARVLPLHWVEIPRDAAAENWRRQRRVTAELAALAASPPADFNDVPCNTDACLDFGGCDFVPLCSVQNPKVGVSKMSFDDGQASALLAKLSALRPPSEPANVSEAPAILPPDAAPRDPMPPPPDEAPPPTKKRRAKRSTDDENTQPITLPPTEIFEYEVDRELVTVTTDVLNERGALGWELVGFFDGCVAVWKRRVY